MIDNKKERFKLDYGGDIVFQAGVKLIRDDKELGVREAGARLFVVSKFDGWDVVTQTIRVTAVGVRPDDRILVKGFCPDTGTPLVTEIVDEGVYCSSHDWMLSLDPGPTASLDTEDVPVKGDPETTVQRIVLTAEAPEIMLRFRPYFRQRHQPA